MLPEKSSAIDCSCSNKTPLVISTRTVADSPSATSGGSTASANSASSVSSTTTSAEAASDDTTWPSPARSVHTYLLSSRTNVSSVEFMDPTTLLCPALNRISIEPSLVQ